MYTAYIQSNIYYRHSKLQVQGYYIIFLTKPYLLALFLVLFVWALNWYTFPTGTQSNPNQKKTNLDFPPIAAEGRDLSRQIFVLTL